MDVQRDHLVLPNRKNPSLTVKRVYPPAGQADLPGALLVWANEQGLAPNAPLFFSRKRGADGGPKAISRVQAWSILKSAAEQADVRVLALRASHHGAVGEPPLRTRTCSATPASARLSAQPITSPSRSTKLDRAASSWPI